MNIYFSLFTVFFRIGLFGFGGGYAMLPLIFQSVQQFGYMSAEEFSNLVALSQITPGPVSVNAATYVGFYEAGLPGAACATLGVAAPSFILVLITTHFLQKFKKSKGIQGVLFGIRPATIGLIAAAAILVAQTSLIDVAGMSVNLLPCILFVCTIVLIGKFKIHPIIITILMGSIGAVLCG